eukprot:m.147108 g.147108  ORF g.147108 m.147108 type:complete len:51 (+) comp16105_c1_seq1:637-789(+)
MNGFYLSLRNKYLANQARIYYFDVEWSAHRLRWKYKPSSGSTWLFTPLHL